MMQFPPLDYLEALRFAELSQPWALWLLIPCALLIAVSAVLRRRSIIVSLLRLLTAAVIVFALADPVQEQSVSHRQVTALVDISASISPQARTACRFWPRPSGWLDPAATPGGYPIC